MNPAPLRARGREHPGELPRQAHGAVADHQFGVVHTACPAAAQQVGPRLGGLLQALGQGDQPRGAIQAHAGQDQDVRVRLPEPDFTGMEHQRVLTTEVMQGDRHCAISPRLRRLPGPFQLIARSQSANPSGHSTRCSRPTLCVWSRRVGGSHGLGELRDRVAGDLVTGLSVGPGGERVVRPARNHVEVEMGY